jgi:hypothetical protein
MCCCGCGAELTDSLYWASEICHIRWLTRQARPEQAAARAYRAALERVTED